MIPLRDIGLLILVAAVWGGNFVVIKLGLVSSEPLALSTLRFFLAAVPACLLIPRPTIPLWRLIAIGMTLGTLMSAFQFIGMNLGVTASVTSVVLQSQAFMTVGLAVILGDPLTTRTWTTMALGILGILCFLLADWGSATLVGLSFVLIAAFWWATSNILMRNTGSARPVAIIAWMSLVPILPLGILSLLFERTPAGPALFQFGLSDVLVGLYLGVGVMIVGYGIWGMMLQRHSTSLVAPFSLLVPVFGAAFGYLFLGETMSLLQFLGTVFLICSVVVVVLPKRVQTPVAD